MERDEISAGGEITEKYQKSCQQERRKNPFAITEKVPKLVYLS